LFQILRFYYKCKTIKISIFERQKINFDALYFLVFLGANPAFHYKFFSSVFLSLQELLSVALQDKKNKRIQKLSVTIWAKK
jgi:hypothetical protein